MEREQELVVKVTKEIVVKFIEMGTVSVASFEEVWKRVLQTVQDALGPRQKQKG